MVWNFISFHIQVGQKIFEILTNQKIKHTKEKGLIYDHILYNSTLEQNSIFSVEKHSYQFISKLNSPQKAILIDFIPIENYSAEIIKSILKVSPKNI
jgi:aspartate carbamoyltransferase regulatory subunit